MGSDESLGMKGYMKKRDTEIVGHTEATGMTGSNRAIRMTAGTQVTEMTGPKGDIGMTDLTGKKGTIEMTNPKGHKGDTGTVGPTRLNREA